LRSAIRNRMKAAASSPDRIMPAGRARAHHKP
jgi:hypothetical protein